MSEKQSSAGSEETEARQQAADYVVERVESWDEGSQPEQVREDLEEGMAEAEVEVEEGELDRMAQDIHDRGRTETPDVG